MMGNWMSDRSKHWSWQDGSCRSKSVVRLKEYMFSNYKWDLCTDDFDSPYLGQLFHLMSSSGEIGHPYFLFFLPFFFFPSLHANFSFCVCRERFSD